MRITGGRARGISLQTRRGHETRPAADALREALFSSLADNIPGSLVLDLFAGSGSYGLEALSRGASHVEFVESDFRCIACIKENLRRVAKSCGVNDTVGIVNKSDVLKWQDRASEKRCLVLVDPPYAIIPAVEKKIFELAGQVLSQDGLLVFEKPADLSLMAEGWKEIKRLGKKRGQAPSISVFQRA